MLRNIILLVSGVMFFAAQALADGHGACAKCHDADEFAGMDAADIVAAAKDASIPPHKKLTVSDDELAAIAAKLAGE